MIKLFEGLKEIRKIKKDEFAYAKTRYIEYYESLPIKEKTVLLESEHGKKLDGNMFYVLKYLATSEKYADYEIYFSSMGRNLARFGEFLISHGMERVKLVMLASDEYMRILASAKVLINDTTFGPYYVKKEGQIYINTWHGTPLKTLGKSDAGDYHNIGNVQKNFLASDYLLYPNEYTRDIMLRDYMLYNIARGKTFLSGYPRNEIFFDKTAAERIREDLELTDKRVYAYMPTYRGSVENGKTDISSAYLIHYLWELDRKLTDGEVMYVNLHPLAKDAVNFSSFKNLRKFPSEYETYEFLNSVDILVTDYSSVFFDFACTGKKTVLFTYDEEEYLSSRGMYMDIRELPFPRTYDVASLLSELRSDKRYEDKEFLEKFCPYESKDASRKMCDSIILGEDCGLSFEPIESNGKKNVLIYAGNLAGNGITASLRSLLSYIDVSKNNYYLTFISSAVSEFKQFLKEMPEGVCYVPIAGGVNFTIKDLKRRNSYSSKMLRADKYMRHVKRRYEQDLVRKFADAKFDTVIQFNGYDGEIILSLSAFSGKKIIWVHSDMVKEAKLKGNTRLDMLKYAYLNYDTVAVVTEAMKEPTFKISGRLDNIAVVKNTINYKSVLEKSTLPIAYDEYTEATVDEDRLKEILATQDKKFISIGRFSPEKGQDRMIRAFAKYNRENPESYLIIIGGYDVSDTYTSLQSLKMELGVADRVILIKQMSNPYSILKKCDCFVLSSHYEGFGLVLAEADILGLPVISTDIDGPRAFMQKYGGTLVPNTEEGVYQGILMLGEGKVKPMGVDYAAYNEESVSEFESIL